MEPLQRAVAPLRRADPARVGPYRLLGRLGAGGMGVVYLGRSGGGRAVAVKVIQRRFADEPRFVARFRREVTAARRVTGVFTAPVLDADPDAATPWLATAYLPGLSLREAVARFGPLPPDAVRPLAAGLAEALADIHRAGVVHRDLKPGNVMLTAGGPRVIDFGIARPADATSITRVNAPVGTPGFMAPEQIDGAPAGPAADVFALGATLAYAATGREPFGDGAPEARDLRALRGRADLAGITAPWLRDLVAACLAVEPERRPSTADVLERLGPPPADAPSLLATGWLPAPVAEEIDRRTALLPPEEPATEDPEVRFASTAEPDAAGPATVADAPPPPPPDLGRRTLLAGAGAAVLTAGGLGTFAWRRTRHRPRARGGDGPAARPPAAPQGPPPDGAARWTRRVSKRGHPPELAAAPGVLLANGDDGNEIVHALDPRTGRFRWTRAGGYAAAPYGGVTYLALAEGREIAAVRSATGRTLWTRSLDFTESGPGEAIAVTDPVVAFGTEQVTALDLRTGRRRWTAKVPARYGISGADGLVLAMVAESLTAIDARTGETRWRHPMDYGDYQVASDGHVFAVDRFGTLHAVRADTGALAWRRPGVAGWGSQAGGGRCYVEGRDGEVLALDAATGRQLWSRPLLARLTDDPRRQATALRLSGGALYAMCGDGVLYGLSAADGRVAWTYASPDPDFVQPASADGLVFIGSGDGGVRAVAPPTVPPRPNGGPRATP